MQSARALVIALAAASLAACGEEMVAPSQNGPGRVVGILELVESRSETGEVPRASAIVAPDTVETGVPFTATITTVATDSCWREAGAEVVAEPRRVIITPYDRFTPRAGCFDAIISLPRAIEVVFTRAGEATLRVQGRRVFDGNLATASPLAVEKRIFVQ